MTELERLAPSAPRRRSLSPTGWAAPLVVALTALAFNVGDPVPASHVERGVVDSSQVAKRDTKAGKAATGQEG